MHSHKPPEWLQDKLKTQRVGKGGQAKPHAKGGGKGKGGPHKCGRFPPCKDCGRPLHPPEDRSTLHRELREKAEAEGRLGKRHNRERCRQRWKSKKIDQACRDMGSSQATVCPTWPIMWVNQAQVWEDSYCTRRIPCISGAKEENVFWVPRAGHAEKFQKGVIVPGIYIPLKGISERIETLLLGDTGNEVIPVAGWKLSPERFPEDATVPFRLLGVGEKELEGGKYVVRSDIIVLVQRKLQQAFTVECFDDIVLFVPPLAPAAS